MSTRSSVLYHSILDRNHHAGPYYHSREHGQLSALCCPWAGVAGAGRSGPHCSTQVPRYMDSILYDPWILATFFCSRMLINASSPEERLPVHQPSNSPSTAPPPNNSSSLKLAVHANFHLSQFLAPSGRIDPTP